MDIINKIIFPRPKSQITLEVSQNVYLVPSFSNNSDYIVFGKGQPRRGAPETPAGSPAKGPQSRIISMKEVLSPKMYAKKDDSQDCLDDSPLSDCASINDEIEKMSREAETKIVPFKTKDEIPADPRPGRIRTSKFIVQQGQDRIRSVQDMPCPNYPSAVPTGSRPHDSKLGDIEIKPPTFIPCLFLKEANSQDVLLYFHSNGEDIILAERFCRALRKGLRKNVVCMEYPGYSVYKCKKTDPRQISYDSEKLVYFLRDTLRVSTKNITILGRSMGSGPAIHLASKFEFKMIVICSGFLSIKKVVSDKFFLASPFVDKTFDNEDLISQNSSPLLILHGKNDGLINLKHAEVLYKKARSKAKLIVFEDMEHNSFNTTECVIKPILEYERKFGGDSQSLPDSRLHLISEFARILPHD